jgi:RNA polymerase sigma factor (sigma-70 family)
MRVATAPRPAPPVSVPFRQTQTGAVPPRVRTHTPQRRLPDNEVAALVASAASGDESAWTRLIAEFGGLVWAVTRSHRLGHEDAADVAQSTWAKLVTHLDRLTEPSRVGAWLATTARRECLRVLRDSRREVFLGDATPDCSTDEPLDTELLFSERDRALWRSFSRLRTSDQALLRLLIAEPRPAYEEIADALDIPIGSIGPTRARALDRLRQELEREWITPADRKET